MPEACLYANLMGWWNPAAMDETLRKMARAEGALGVLDIDWSAERPRIELTGGVGPHEVAAAALLVAGAGAVLVAHRRLVAILALGLFDQDVDGVAHLHENSSVLVHEFLNRKIQIQPDALCNAVAIVVRIKFVSVGR